MLEIFIFIVVFATILLVIVALSGEEAEKTSKTYLEIQNKMLNQSLVTEDKYEHIKHNPSSKVCNWICQAITWILLICLIVSLVIKGFYSGIFIPGFFFLVAYLSYLAINFSSKALILLSSN